MRANFTAYRGRRPGQAAFPMATIKETFEAGSARLALNLSAVEVEMDRNEDAQITKFHA